MVGEIGNPRLIIEWWATSSANSTDLEPAQMRSLFCNVQFVLAKARVQLNCYCYTFHVIKKGKWKIFARTALDWTSYTFTQGGGGAQKGYMSPPPHEVTTRHTLPPEKKVNYWSYDSKSVMQKMVTVWVGLIKSYAITECKNGRALVKHGNNLPLIRYQTTPHCDARDSKCQIEPWDERRNLTPYANCKDISFWQCDLCFLAAIQVWVMSFNVTKD